jgi:outer membrane lipoprotein-sorting protein
MRTFVQIKGLLLCALLFVAQSAITSSARAQDFEGRVIMTVLSPATNNVRSEMSMNFKGDKMMMSMDVAGTALKMYSQNWGTKLVIVMEAMNMGFETELTTPTAQPASAITSNLKPTGKKETVNGFAAEEWAIVDEEKSTVMWLTSDIDKSILKSWGALNKIQQAQNPDQGRAEMDRIITEKGLMPVRIVFSESGEAQATIDLVKVEKTSIPDSVFVLPSNITIQKVDASMLQQAD